VHEISAAAITAAEKPDHGNGSGSIRLVWGKLLEEKGARRGWPVDLGRARGAERGHGQRGVRAERNRGVRARGGIRKVEGRPLTSGPQCQWRAGDASWQVGRAGGRGVNWACGVEVAGLLGSVGLVD